MVQCVCINCSEWSDNVVKVSLYRIPVVRKGRSQREYELSLKRRDGFLAAISRDDLPFGQVQNLFDTFCFRPSTRSI